MTEKEQETQLPSSEELLAAYEKLFGKNRTGVKHYKKSGVYYVELPHDMVLIEQNAQKDSHWAQKAREGQKIAWVMKDGEYLARVVQGKVEILHRK